MNASSVPRVKKVVRSISAQDARQALKKLRGLCTTAEVTAVVNELIESRDLQRYVVTSRDRN